MVLRHLLQKRDARKEREKLEVKFKEGIERGRQLEREAQASRCNANNSNGNQNPE